jgi:hypothetical protein
VIALIPSIIDGALLFYFRSAVPDAAPENGIPDHVGRSFSPLEHDPEKREPVFRKDHLQPKMRS